MIRPKGTGNRARSADSGVEVIQAVDVQSGSGAALIRREDNEIVHAIRRGIDVEGVFRGEIAVTHGVAASGHDLLPIAIQVVLLFRAEIDRVGNRATPAECWRRDEIPTEDLLNITRLLLELQILADALGVGVDHVAMGPILD